MSSNGRIPTVTSTGRIVTNSEGNASLFLDASGITGETPERVRYSEQVLSAIQATRANPLLASIVYNNGEVHSDIQRAYREGGREAAMLVAHAELSRPTEAQVTLANLEAIDIDLETQQARGSQAVGVKPISDLGIIVT